MISQNDSTCISMYLPQKSPAICRTFIIKSILDKQVLLQKVYGVYQSLQSKLLSKDIQRSSLKIERDSHLPRVIFPLAVKSLALPQPVLEMPDQCTCLPSIVIFPDSICQEQIWTKLRRLHVCKSFSLEKRERGGDVWLGCFFSE